MSRHGEFFTWSRFLDVNVLDGRLPADEMKARTIGITYVDRDRDFDTLEWQLDNSDGVLTRPEYLAAGMLVQMRMGYADAAFPWKSFIVNRVQGGMGVFGKSGNAAVGSKESVVTFYGRNRNAPGGRSARPFSKTAREPSARRPSKIFGPTMQDASFHEMLLRQDQGPEYILVDYPNSMTSDAVAAVARRNGFDGQFAIIQPTNDFIEALTIQAGDSDGETLLKLAKRWGFIFKLDGDTLRWHSKNWKGANYKLADVLDYGVSPDILEAWIDCDLRLPLPNAITAKGYNWNRRAVEVFDAKRDEANKKANVGMGVFETLLKDQGRYNLLTQGQTFPVVATGITAVESKAINAFVQKHVRAFQLNVTTVGNPTLLASRLLPIRGTGSPFIDQTWLIAEARHTYGNVDYKTEVKLKFPPKQVATVRIYGEVQDKARDAADRIPRVGGAGFEFTKKQLAQLRR